MDLRNLWAEAINSGWASGQGPLSHLKYLATSIDWEPVETRRGEGRISTLRPTKRQDAHPRSMSGIHGLEEQPLHVDGSHMPTPPDAVILHSASVSATPTNLFHYAQEHSEPYSALTNGLFLVGTGPWAFLAPAVDQSGLRYDPTIMEPADARARQAAEYLEAKQSAPEKFYWTEPNTFLIIHNRSVLHGRSAVVDGNDKRVLTRMAYYVGARS